MKIKNNIFEKKIYSNLLIIVIIQRIYEFFMY